MTRFFKIFRFQQVVIHARRGNGAKRLRLELGQVTVDLNTLAEKAEHVVTNGLYWRASFHLFQIIDPVEEWADVLKSPLSLLWRDVYRKLTTAKVVTKSSRRIKDQAATDDQFPPFLKTFLFTDELEIVDVHAEDKLKPAVVKEALPPGNGFELALH